MSHLAPCSPSMRPVRCRAIGRSIDRSLPNARSAILAVLDKASDDQIARGLAWYGAAHDISADLGRLAGLDLRGGAGLLAVLSPKCSWSVNVENAYAIASDGADGFPFLSADQERKVRAILAGTDPYLVLGGRKVRSFFANIVEPGRHGAVTIDRHAVASVLGRRASDQEIKNLLEKVGGYAILAAEYRAVARDIGWNPADLQAVTWITWRETTGADDEDREVF